MLGALSVPSVYFSPLLSQTFSRIAVSPSPAAPLCWAFCSPPREQVGPTGFCAQGLGGRCSVPGASGMVASGQPCCWSGCTDSGLWACVPGQLGLLIRVGTHLGFRCGRPGHWSGYHTLWGFQPVSLGSRAADRGVHQPGFRCVLGLLIWCSQSRGWGGGGARGQGCWGEFSKQPLSASIFSFTFWEIPPIQAPWSIQAPGLSHSPAWFSPKNLAAVPAAPAGGFSHPGPRDLIDL